jgi:hypothetical protein
MEFAGPSATPRVHADFASSCEPSAHRGPADVSGCSGRLGEGAGSNGLPGLGVWMRQLWAVVDRGLVRRVPSEVDSRHPCLSGKPDLLRRALHGTRCCQDRVEDHQRSSMGVGRTYDTGAACHLRMTMGSAQCRACDAAQAGATGSRAPGPTREVENGPPADLQPIVLVADPGALDHRLGRTRRSTG